MAPKKKVGTLKRKSVSMKRAAKVKGGSTKFKTSKLMKDTTLGGTDHGTHGESGSDHG